MPGVRGEPLPEGTVIVGQQKGELTDMAGGLATRVDELIGAATALMSDQLATDIHNTLIATQKALDVLAKAGSGPLIAQTTSTLAATERTMARLDSLLGSTGGKRVDSITANIARLTNNLGAATASLDTLLGGANRGQGTLGKMAHDSTLYVKMNETLTALTALLNDLRERPGRYLTVKVF
jgi:phospholipid/cholesterol/gamma-HCH transport system substrate-binding protein